MSGLWRTLQLFSRGFRRLFQVITEFLCQGQEPAGLWLAAKFFGCNIAFRQPQVVQSGSPGGRAES